MDQLSVETPIGSLIFTTNASESAMSETHLSECNIEPSLPKGMSVKGCKAVLLRCQSSAPIKDIEFSCSWIGKQETGYGNSGEGLDAWEWENGHTLVMVGTEDSEYLSSRVNIKESSSTEYPITMKSNVIKIHIHEYPANKELTLHYIIAWNPTPEEVESSCWYAVDIPHEKVLEICK